MNTEKAKLTWHYYLMALGALMVMLAATLSAWSAVVVALAFSLLTHPIIKCLLKLPGLGRFIFLIIFAVFYVFAFPDSSVVKEVMLDKLAK